MRCFMCGRELRQLVTSSIGIQKCQQCQLVYVKRRYLDLLVKQKAKLFKEWRATSKKHLDLSVGSIQFTQYKQLGAKPNCHGSCIDICTCLQFKHKGFKFYYCPFKELYAFQMEELLKFIKRQLFKAQVLGFLSKLMFWRGRD